MPKFCARIVVILLILCLMADRSLFASMGVDQPVHRTVCQPGGIPHRLFPCQTMAVPSLMTGLQCLVTGEKPIVMQKTTNIFGHTPPVAPTPETSEDHWLVTPADAVALDAFLNQEALKISREFWGLLPFIPDRARADLPELADQSPFIRLLLKGYQIACRIHGAPEEENPLNNQLAKRQLRANGAPYIIHILGVVWAAAHVSDIREGRVLIADTVHDVPEDAFKNMRALNPGISETQAERLVREVFLTALQEEAEPILSLLQWYVRGNRTYREYIDTFKMAPLNVLLSKLLDQANNLYDIPYLMTHGQKDRAQRQVGKTLRYFSELISLEAHQYHPRYRPTVIYLLKTLIRASDKVDWLEPFYERLPGSRESAENTDLADPEILAGLARFQQCLKQPWVKSAMREEQGTWGPSVDLATTQRFSKRVDQLRQRIDEGVALPAQYTDPEAYAKRGLERYPDVMTVIYDVRGSAEGLAQVKAHIEAASLAIGGQRTGEYLIEGDKNRRSGLLSITTALHRPLGMSLQVVQERLWPILLRTMAVHEVALSTPGKKNESASGYDPGGFFARTIETPDVPELEDLFYKLPKPGRSAAQKRLFLRQVRRLLSDNPRSFGLVWEDRERVLSSDIAAAVLARLEPDGPLVRVRILDILVESSAMGIGIGDELLHLAVECARRIPRAKEIVMDPVEEWCVSVLRRLGFTRRGIDGESGLWVLKIRRSA